MAAPEKLGLGPHVGVSVDLADSQVEALGRNAVGRGQDGGEHDAVIAVLEDAEEGWLPVVCVEATEESMVGDEASPALADGGGAGEGGRLRREAEEDLGEQILVLQGRARAGAVVEGGRHGAYREEGGGGAV